MRTTIRKGDFVRVGFDDSIPVRYQGRSALVVKREKAGRGFRYQVEFSNRRVNPLPVPASALTLI